MKPTDQDFLNTALRNDLLAFVHRSVLWLDPGAVFLPNWHLEAICYQLMRILRGDRTRLIINMPPRSLKSILTSVVFPAFLLGHDPRRRIFGVSYSNDLSAKHAGDFRSIVQSPWYRRAFPNNQVARTADSDLYTSDRGFRRATSVNATLTGLGGDCFIIDDPQKPIDAQSEVQRNGLNDWFFNTLMSRLDNKATGSIILVQQRVHLNDLTGHLLENPSDWEHLSLPAIAEADERILIGENRFHLRRAGEALHPEREPIEVLQNLQRELGPDIFAAQYQQAPVPPGGAMIKRAWLRYYDTLPERKYGVKVIQSWDTAAKGGAQNSWSVCTTWMFVDGYFYLLDLTRGRFEYPQLRDTAIALAERFEPNAILIEDASTGVSLAQELRPALPFTIKPIPVHHDKPGRLYVCTGKFAAGLVHFPRGARFLRELELELLTFPQSKTTDQVDSISQALNHKPSSYDSSMRWVRGDYDDDRVSPAREISVPVHPLAQVRNRRR